MSGDGMSGDGWMVAIVIGMGGANTTLGSGKSGIGTHCSRGGLRGRPLTLGTTNGRGVEEQLGKQTTIGKWQRHQTQLTTAPLPQSRKSSGQIQMTQTHLRLPRPDVIKMTSPQLTQSGKRPMPNAPQSRRIPRTWRASAPTGRCSMLHTTVLSTQINRRLTTHCRRFQQLRLGMSPRAMHSSKLHGSGVRSLRNSRLWTGSAKRPQWRLPPRPPPQSRHVHA